MRACQILPIAAVVVLVSACTDIYGYVPRNVMNATGTLNVISTAVTMGTDKTLTDHVVSLSTGKNCSTVRTEQGRTYCVEGEANPEPEVYCYRTLADVTCYAAPDPARPNDLTVGTF